jgi:uncharacterized membrane protein (GlpM family)
LDTSFWVRLGVSFVVGSAWVTLSSLAAERFGSKIGGLIGGLPSTVVVTLLFIGLTQTPESAASATIFIPLGMGINGIFMIVYVLFARRGLWVALAGSILAWSCLAGMLVVLEIPHLWISLLAWVLLGTCCTLLIEKCMKIASKERRTIHFTGGQIIGRTVFGGAVIAFAVFMGKLAGPMRGGIFATFPAMFISTLVIAHRTGGGEFSRAVAKSLMVSGMINVPLYALSVRFLYPAVGLGYGTFMAVVLSAGSGYLTYWFIKTTLT